MLTVKKKGKSWKFSSWDEKKVTSPEQKVRLEGTQESNGNEIVRTKRMEKKKAKTRRGYDFISISSLVKH